MGYNFVSCSLGYAFTTEDLVMIGQSRTIVRHGKEILIKKDENLNTSANKAVGMQVADESQAQKFLDTAGLTDPQIANASN